MNDLELKGHLHIECVNPDGSIAWEDDIRNMATTVGLNHLLNTEFGAGAQASTWYLGVIDNSGFSTLSAGDTMASHPGWNEYTSYSESVRQTWTPSAASGGSVANASTANFTVNASGTSVYGFFLTSDSAKSGVAGTIFATAALSAVQSPTSGQVLRVTYTITATATN